MASPGESHACSGTSLLPTLSLTENLGFLEMWYDKASAAAPAAVVPCPSW